MVTFRADGAAWLVERGTPIVFREVIDTASHDLAAAPSDMPGRTPHLHHTLTVKACVPSLHLVGQDTSPLRTATGDAASQLDFEMLALCSPRVPVGSTTYLFHRQ